jgi:hypothetical protein
MQGNTAGYRNSKNRIGVLFLFSEVSVLGESTAQRLYRQFGCDLALLAQKLGVRIVQNLDVPRAALIYSTLFCASDTPPKYILYCLGYAALHPDATVVADTPTDFEASAFADEWLLLTAA